MDSEQMDNGKISFEFSASALEYFGRALLMGILVILLFPGPWAIGWFNRWFVKNIRMSDSTQIHFVGTGRQIWAPVVLLWLLNVAGNFIPGVWNLLFSLVSFPLSCLVYIFMMRWFVENIVLNPGPALSFQGKYLSYLGWMLLMILSMFTIIGWAWAVVAMYRWMCRNVDWAGHTVEFNATGWGLLWRSVVGILGCILIIPIPWISLWLTKWYISNVSVRPVTVS